MRILAVAILAVSTISAAGPVAAQANASGYAVCLQVYGPATYYECGYSTLAQCNASASGRAAQCVPNPYYGAHAELPAAGGKQSRRRH